MAADTRFDLAGASAPAARWPELPWRSWEPTLSTLHMWVQIVGKVRLALAPPLNHWWHVPLYVTARGMTTSPIPYGDREFQVDFDFVDHRLQVTDGDPGAFSMALEPRSVARFYREFLAGLQARGIDVDISRRPVEVADAIPFDQDEGHASYDPHHAQQLWRALVQVDRVLKGFQTGFVGKASPVHFFWGGFDLTTTRFSGRPAPRHPGGVPNCPDWVMEESESHQNVHRRLVAPGRRARPGVLRIRLSRARRFSDCHRPSRRTRSSTPGSASSCCRTTASGRPPIRTRPYFSSCNRPTRRVPTWAAGTAARSSRPSCLAALRDGRGALADDHRRRLPPVAFTSKEP